MTETERVRALLQHPIVDADGHFIQFMPLVKDIARELAGPSVVKRFEDGNRSAGYTPVRGFWGLPERNTLDRMTATLPALLYSRLDEIGLDFAVLYPTSARMNMHPDPEVRGAFCRALNIYSAEVYAEYSDRLAPAAVIPLHTPQEAIDELDFAVGRLGLKATMMEAAVPRDVRPDGTVTNWVDTIGHGSPYCYDPVWERCRELKVVPSFHGVAFGWGTRTSATNYVHNHIGAFATAQEGACRSIVMGGVARRFADLRFNFLEGGTAWALELCSGLLGHFAKRNSEAVRQYDPREFDSALGADLFTRFARGRMVGREAEFAAAVEAAKQAPDDPIGYDDFAESGIASAEDILDMFDRQFAFGCEADDRLNALAFDRRFLPGGRRLNAMFSSDIGHWDVPDMSRVLAEAWELVDDGVLSEEEFRSFTFDNAVRTITAVNPGFFDGTAVAGAVAERAQREDAVR